MKSGKGYLERMREQGNIPGLFPDTNLPDYSDKLKLYFEGMLLKKRGTNEILNFDPIVGLLRRPYSITR